jgi:2-oxo-4-hydroxy-4-carboxy--5-ureidoimidazoline (OHCU) decarboxylase
MLIIFEDLIWVTQNAAQGNTQDTVTDLAISFMQAVLAIRQRKKLSLKISLFQAAGSKE